MLAQAASTGRAKARAAGELGQGTPRPCHGIISSYLGSTAEVSCWKESSDRGFDLSEFPKYCQCPQLFLQVVLKIRALGRVDGG